MESGTDLNSCFHNCSNPDIKSWNDLSNFISSNYDGFLSLDIILYDTVNDQSTTVQALIPDCSDRRIVLIGVNREGNLEYLSFYYNSNGDILGNDWENYVINPEDLFNSSNKVLTASNYQNAVVLLSNNPVGTRVRIKSSKDTPLLKFDGVEFDTYGGSYNNTDIFNDTYDRQLISWDIFLESINITKSTSDKTIIEGLFNLISFSDEDSYNRLFIYSGSGHFKIDGDNENQIILSAPFVVGRY